MTQRGCRKTQVSISHHTTWNSGLPGCSEAFYPALHLSVGYLKNVGPYQSPDSGVVGFVVGR